jgi:hypothetical protein
VPTRLAAKEATTRMKSKLIALATLLAIALPAIAVATGSKRG